MSELENVTTWKRRLGYLPIPLFGMPGERRFVLLNGTAGNFCLDVGEQDTAQDRRNSYAWSADVDHYVRIEGSNVLVSRWDRGGSERYALRDLEDNLDSFQDYLERDRAPKERSVTAHAIRVYRRLRSVFAGSGDEALLAYLALLLRAWQQTDAGPRRAHWEDAAAAAAALSRVSSQGQTTLLNDLVSRTALDDNKPDFDLILRHAAGRIFQEAHYLVDLSPQLDFYGFSDTVPVGQATRASGAYFTPTPLVRTLVEQTLQRMNLRKSSLRIFDPACGSGEFLREVLRQLHEFNYAGRVHVVGFDVSSAACLMARFALSMESVHWSNRLAFSIERRDSTADEPWPTDIDGCLMNPPYVSWAHLGREQQDRLAVALGDHYMHRPDLSSAFLLRAVRSLGAEGAIGAVMPASMLDGRSAAPLRAALVEDVDLCMLARLGDQAVFSNAMVDPSLIVAAKKRAAGATGTIMLWADHLPKSSAAALRDLRGWGSKSRLRPSIPLREFSDACS